MFRLPRMLEYRPSAGSLGTRVGDAIMSTIVERAKGPASPYQTVAECAQGSQHSSTSRSLGLVDWGARGRQTVGIVLRQAPCSREAERGKRRPAATGGSSGFRRVGPAMRVGHQGLRGVGKVRLRRSSATTSIRRAGRTILAARVLLASVVFVAGMAQAAPAAAAGQRIEAQSSTVAVNTVAMPAATFGDGTFHVGAGLQPGTYRTRVAAPFGCYWERLSGFGGTLDEIIANDLTAGTSVATIAPTDVGFSFSRCGTWTTDLSPIVLPGTPFAEGTFIVGTDLAPGTYQSSSSVSAATGQDLVASAGRWTTSSRMTSPMRRPSSPSRPRTLASSQTTAAEAGSVRVWLRTVPERFPESGRIRHRAQRYRESLERSGRHSHRIPRPVHFASSDSTAVLPADYTFTSGDAGVHVFSVTLRAFGIHSITATDTVTGAVTGSQQGISVASNPATYHPSALFGCSTHARITVSLLA